MIALWRDRRGAAAIEFATVGTALIALLLFTLYLGFRLYAQVAIDYAAARAARLLSVDATQSRTGSVASFQAGTLCPLLAPFLDCSQVKVALWPVTDYFAGAAPPGNGQTFAPGQGGSLMMLRVTYALPDFGWPAPDGSGSTAMAGILVTGAYPFLNEY